MSDDMNSLCHMVFCPLTQRDVCCIAFPPANKHGRRDRRTDGQYIVMPNALGVFIDAPPNQNKLGYAAVQQGIALAWLARWWASYL